MPPWAAGGPRRRLGRAAAFPLRGSQSRPSAFGHKAPLLPPESRQRNEKKAERARGPPIFRDNRWRPPVEAHGETIRAAFSATAPDLRRGDRPTRMRTARNFRRLATAGPVSETPRSAEWCVVQSEANRSPPSFPVQPEFTGNPPAGKGRREAPAACVRQFSARPAGSSLRTATGKYQPVSRDPADPGRGGSGECQFSTHCGHSSPEGPA
jgi:hypothetical protein